MRQLMYLKKGLLEWREVPEPVLQSPKEAIVRPLVASRCDGDNLPLFNNVTSPMRLGLALHYLDPITADAFGRAPYRGPFAIGHECVAEIVSCGEEVKHFRPGAKVIVPWSISCGGCRHCNLGLTSKCLEAGETLISAYGFGPTMGPWGGMVSDLVRVPYADAMLVPVPTGIDPLHLASASDNIPDGWRMVGPHLKRRPGAPVLIVGGGARSIGLYAAAIAVAMKSSQVDYLDNNRERLALAESVGANPVEISPRSRWLRRHAPRVSGRYPITADASVNRAGLDFALRSLSAGGVCTGVGYYFQRRTGLPLMQMYLNSSTLHVGVAHARAELPEVLNLVAGGAFKPEKITTLVADWDDAPNAFLERTTKVVVRRAPTTVLEN